MLLRFLLLALAAPAFAQSPNIVYILADDLGYGDVSCYNADSKIKTPHIDRLAAGGVRFTDAHSNSAVCTPTRYGILTGRYAWRTSLKRGVLYGYDTPLIESGRVTVAKLLKDRGYATACIGKWHLGLGWALKDTAKPSEANVDFTKPLSAGPHTLGFDHSFIIPASLDMDPYVYIEDGRVVETPNAKIAASPRPAMWRGGWAAKSFKHENCVADFVSKSEAFIDARARDSKPFFLYLPLTSPHTPHVPREQFKGKSDAGVYGDFVIETDWAVGRILEALARNKLDQNTLVIFTSDNGSHSEPLKLAGHASNGPWRGQKSDAWEGGHRVPFIARWPEKIKPGVCGQTICHTDFIATVAEMINHKLPNDAAEDSVSILPLLTGQNKPVREATVLHSINGEFAIRQGPWKLILCRGSGGWSLPEPKAKDLPERQLYDLADDSAESKNLIADHPEVAAKLAALLDRYQKDGRSVARKVD